MCSSCAAHALLRCTNNDGQNKECRHSIERASREVLPGLPSDGMEEGEGEESKTLPSLLQHFARSTTCEVLPDGLSLGQRQQKKKETYCGELVAVPEEVKERLE